MIIKSILRRAPVPLLGRAAALLYRGRELHGANVDYRRFIILGHARTGSTLLSSTLRHCAGVWCFSELFNATTIQFFTPGLPNDSGILMAYRQRDPVGFIDRFVFRGYRSHIEAVGFKLFAEQARLDYMAPLVERIDADRELRFIHIFRRNHLRTLLSLQLARKTAHWSSKGGAHPEDERVAIEPDDLVRFSETRSADELFLRQRFAGQRLLAVEYEELVRDLPQAFGEIQEFLGLERKDVAPMLEKQTTGTLRDRIVNYDELREAIVGTAYEGFLEET